MPGEPDWPRAELRGVSNGLPAPGSSGDAGSQGPVTSPCPAAPAQARESRLPPGQAAAGVTHVQLTPAVPLLHLAGASQTVPCMWSLLSVCIASVAQGRLLRNIDPGSWTYLK